MKSFGEAANLDRIKPILPVAGASTNVSFTAASASSAKLTKDTVYIGIANQACHIRFGTSAPTAVATDFLVPANTYFSFCTGVELGIRYVAAIRDSADGTLYLLPSQ